MVDLSQAEYGRAARGVPIHPGEPPDIEQFLLGMRSSAGAAIRRVHSDSPDVARAYFAGKMSGYLFQGGAVAAFATGLRDCIEQYIAWDGQGGPALAMPTKGIAIPFGQGDVVRARPDVVLDSGGGQLEARALLWDDVPLDRNAAELIALPILERVESEFGAGSTGYISVWQLQIGGRETVLPATAQGRRTDVEALLAGL